MSSESLFPNIPSQWTVTTLGELAKASGGDIQTGPFGSQLHASDYVDDGVPSIMPKNISVDAITTDDIARVSPEDVERLSKYKVQVGDIVYSRRGDVEKCARITEKEDGWLCGTGCLRVRVKPSTVSPEYLHAYLCHPSVREWIVRHAVGATMPNLNTSILSALPVVIPSNPEMATIASIWLTISDKIQLNSQINQTLEEMAQAIFKSWFVDFEPVKAKISALEAGGSEVDALLAAMQAISGKGETELTRLQAEQPEQYAELRATAELFPSAMQDSELGEIPEGWEVLPILEVCDLLGGAQPPASTFVDEELPGYIRLLQIRDFTNDNHLTFVPDSKKLRKVGEDGVLIGRYGSASGNKEKDSLGRICRGKSGAYNVALMKLSPQKAGIEFCLQLFSSTDFYHYLRGTSTKAVQSGFSKKELKQYQVCLPSVGLREKYEALGQLIWSQQKRLTEQSKTLEETRDTLLPKLLSGELSASGAKQQLKGMGATEPADV